ncbi:MAG: pantetheine-phosphate adenylyltransferase [Nitrospirae bacterium CG_4_9_14_3_um_filter_53_35]|nr:MAG: pantetheine-phosphate adenylyltransferase [Nitrospirae bacterium CG2_30_53_67]PIS38057.1 MAG: pantetheine-phosphate adenylyltransferase [Nitrospirae bacterium CG08_land_8_20_14_0_20_52_24]PIV85675.1 MAG: pantetheine-phosphate adenylyltransferase [Nitrospirae bacterium CG17_big_fil_post_rev_8_21_14_2_50_50_9]PIW85424.1 MAG: pantetheine-phosphate adenylyltransferase [Nitrospirae bacterium CG_4_8_14_3_um_filter_50_41]PIX86208.1 MAG: pantetheine-phosphate adenylyltransferase [Nitrospirae ba
MERKLKNKIAVYPGTFDPITNGHVDLIERGLRIFDRIIIAVAPSLNKSPFFTLEERVDLIREVIGRNSRIEIDVIEGLLVEYVRKNKAVAVIRGLRAVSDFEYEFQLALMNRKMDPNFETVFLMPSERYTYLSSSIIKEVAKLGGSLKDMVPVVVENKLKEKINQ